MSKPRFGRVLNDNDSRPPIAIQQQQLSPELLQYLQDCTPFQAAVDKLAAFGFEKHIDHPNCPDHIYYEAYFHGLWAQRGKSFVSIHPRFGYDFPKPPAPDRLVAFVEALRRENEVFLTELSAKLPSDSFLKKCMDAGNVFADFSVQIHFGQEISAEHVAWHCDAFNSALHLALSIHGTRALHLKTSSTNQVKAPLEEEVVWQQAGNTYLSCPFAFPHAVQYTGCDWDNRIIAVQCRLLITEADFQNRYEKWTGDLVVLNEVMGTCQLRMPSLEMVKVLEAEIRAPKKSWLSRFFKK
eukprot:c17598_g1_i1.p1 GENE.c17598_g1_i1~~c17598_g1_i1.p1  ORF type:complete len:297 (-),score=61.12 c17598_g1_i1:42-932(-)